MMRFFMQYWLEVLCGGVLTLLGCGYRTLAKRLKEQESVKLGVQALLRDRIIAAYNHYMEKGYCPIYARENLRRLYEQYHNLGGNGTITHLVTGLEELPTDKKEALYGGTME